MNFFAAFSMISNKQIIMGNIMTTFTIKRMTNFVTIFTKSHSVCINKMTSHSGNCKAANLKEGTENRASNSPASKRLGRGVAMPGWMFLSDEA